MPTARVKKSAPKATARLFVGIGASAGGLESLQALLRALPKESDIGILVSLHNDPDSAELLSDVLSKAALMPVVEAQNGTPIESGFVYVIPGHSVAEVKKGILQLNYVEPQSQRRNPIDKLFYSLARDQGEKIVGVILSGNGDDGAHGLKEISRQGGMTLAQDPATAKHSEMPQHAVDTGAADHTLAPVAIAEEILAYAEHLGASGHKDAFEKLHEQVEAHLSEICELLVDATGHNFRHYKTSTLSRRIQRRIQVLRISTAKTYVQRLRKDPVEARQLFNDLLIGVTSFFRDPDAFEALKNEVLVPLFEHKKNDVIRVWVPGCSTGEEAYTLAMLLKEHLDTVSFKPEIQIFATDIDEESLRTARTGIYPASIATEIEPERLKRFFIKKAQHFHISKDIRSMVLFSVHNLINDPPFSKLDLISCRNLLIYLGAHLQKKLIPLFHYALAAGGYLFLGPSENLSTHRELFKPVNAKFRISQRLATPVRASAIFSGRSSTTPVTVRPPNAAASDTDIYLLMQRIILDEFAPKSLVVDEEGQIICASGNLEKYLTVSAGAFHSTASRLVKEGLRVGVRTTLAEAIEKRRQITNDGLFLRVEGGLQRIMLTVQPMPHMGTEAGLFLVVFQDVGLPFTEENMPQHIGDKAGALIEQLEHELFSAREDLERNIQDMEAINEEIKSSNEELLSMNEELQSANEELETSKEEVQAAYDGLNRANTDLENLLASTQIATLFMDELGNVRRTTPSITSIYNVLPTDMGRPLTHFTHNAKAMPALPTLKAVYESKTPIDDEFEAKDGNWYLRRILPYRNQDGEFEGMVLMFNEITERKLKNIALRLREQQLRLAIGASKLGVWQWDPKTDIITMSPRGAEIYGVTPGATFLRSDMRKALLNPEHQAAASKMLEHALEYKTDYEMEYEVTRADGTTVWIHAVGAGEYDSNNNIVGMHGIIQDISESKLVEERLINSERLYRGIGESIDYGIWISEADGKNVYASDSFLNLVGITQEQCSEFGWGDILHPDDAEATIAAWKQCVKEGSVWDREHRFKGVDGQWHSVLARGIPVKDDNGKVLSWVGINLDISEMKKAEDDLRLSEERFRRMADSAPVLMWISDTAKQRNWFNQPWLEFVGRTLEKETGEGWLENVHPDDIGRIRQKYFAATDVEGLFRMEYRLKRNDGEYRWMLSTCTPLYDAKDSFIGYIGTTVDISDHKMSVEALKDADRRKDEFLAMLAHELRNPLAPISNALQVMRMTSGSKPEVMKSIQDVMERQLAHMVRLIDDLLDVSRITRGHIEIQPQRMDVNAAIQHAVEISTPLVLSKNHKLKVSAPDVPVYVMGDLTRLSQVIANLLNNAAKYTLSGGVIELSLHVKGANAIMTIKDNGIGIPEDMHSKIFDVFVQVDTALERSEGGLGIGLTLVRKLVGLHGGTITVASKPGKGSVFTITLPLLKG